MTVSTIKMTAEQSLQLGEDPSGVRLELVDGEIAIDHGQTDLKIPLKRIWFQTAK